MPDWLHLDLERPGDRDALHSDIEGFFGANPRRVVIDEAQRLPEVFEALRHIIDLRHAKGRFLLLGSAGPSLVRAVSESLAGRVGMLELTPFRANELAGSRRAKDRWFWGGFPPVHALSNAGQRSRWMESYVAAFLERDLPALGIRLPAQRLRTLWMMLTQVHGNLLNVSDLARSLAVSVPTVSRYLDVLEGACMIRRLFPHFANIQKRLTKRPKIFLRDTGLLHFLAGLRRPSELETWDRRGNSFAGLVIEELISAAKDRYVRPHLAFWRTHAGAEVDLLIGNGKRLLPIEIKLGSSAGQYAVAGLRQCMKDLGLTRGWVITTGTERRSVGRGIEIVPWEAIASGDFDFGLGK